LNSNVYFRRAMVGSFSSVRAAFYPLGAPTIRGEAQTGQRGFQTLFRLSSPYLFVLSLSPASLLIFPSHFPITPASGEEAVA
jgi:hypothetical protein